MLKRKAKEQEADHDELDVINFTNLILFIKFISLIDLLLK